MASISAMTMTTLGTSMAAVTPFPVSTDYVVKVIHLMNTTNTDLTVQVCLVPDGGSPAQGNALLWDFTVPANDFMEFGQGIVVPADGTIQALASAGGSVNIGVSGIVL